MDVGSHNLKDLVLLNLTQMQISTTSKSASSSD